VGDVVPERRGGVYAQCCERVCGKFVVVPLLHMGGSDFAETQEKQIGKTSGLAMCLTGILKNILLVVASVLIWKTAITPLQFIGYAIACFGLVYYSLGWEQMVAQSAAGWHYVKNVWDQDDGATSIGIGNGISVSVKQVRRAVIFGLGLMTVGLLFYGLVPVSDQVATTTKL